MSSSSSPISQNDTVNNSNGVSAPLNDEQPAPAPTLPTNRSNRPARACAIRAAERLQAAQQRAATERKQKPNRNHNKREQLQKQQLFDESLEQKEQCGANNKIITPLTVPPEPAQLPRWSLRSMWELASILNFLHVFRSLLNIQIEFSAEEFETSLITPNDTLGDIHMPLLKAIPPITRMALTQDTWITVLCRKLRDWWHWVADGELPIVASHGVEVEVYKTLDPGVRVVILKALCDIRVEQEDIRNYIDHSFKHGIQPSVFCKECIGGDSQGINYWYEDDPIIGHRLYREIRKVEVNKAKVKGSKIMPKTTYLWETVARNLEEFQDVSEKLFASKNRTEVSLGKKLKNDMLSEIEKVHKRKERLLKKQHRQALLLDNFSSVDGLGPGRSLRDRKPVTYTFDDYDRSIDEAIKMTKRKPPSPEPIHRREDVFKPEASENGLWSGPSHVSEHCTFNSTCPDSPGYDDVKKEYKTEQLDHSNRQRQRPQRNLAREFVEAVSDIELDFDSDNDIVGEAIYDEEYLRKRKQRRKLSSSSASEGDEDYQWDGESGKEEDSQSYSESSDEQKYKNLPAHSRKETKSRSVHDHRSGLRRSKRATQNRINYRQYEMSESEGESMKPEKSNALKEHSDASEYTNCSTGSQESGDSDGEEQDIKVDHSCEGYDGAVGRVQNQSLEKSNNPDKDEVEEARKRQFLDLNELAPGSGFDDDPNTIMKDGDRDKF